MKTILTILTLLAALAGSVQAADWPETIDRDGNYGNSGYTRLMFEDGRCEASISSRPSAENPCPFRGRPGRQSFRSFFLSGSRDRSRDGYRLAIVLDDNDEPVSPKTDTTKYDHIVRLLQREMDYALRDIRKCSRVYQRDGGEGVDRVDGPFQLLLLAWVNSDTQCRLVEPSNGDDN